VIWDAKCNRDQPYNQCNTRKKEPDGSRHHQWSLYLIMTEINVTTQESDLPIEQLLSQRITAAPAAYLRQLLKKGRVVRDAKKLQEGDTVNVGDIITLPDSQRLLELLENPQQQNPQQPKIDVLYESRELLIVYKTAGLAIHNSKGHERDNLTDRVALFLSTRGETFQVAPIQRLDLETSGPVLFGKGRKGCSELGKVFMQGNVTKIYLALVSGKLQGRGELISDIPAKGKLKTAQTNYQTLISNDSASLLEIELQTGRQHQIRRQLADAGHPLYGDRRYRGLCPRKLPRLFLHCRRLAFIDPFSKQQIDINCSLPKELSRFLPQLGLET